jgi:hypothetical protein
MEMNKKRVPKPVFTVLPSADGCREAGSFAAATEAGSCMEKVSEKRVRASET